MSPDTKLIKGVDTINEFILDREDVLEKGGKKAVIGEVRQFGGKSYVKGPSGWRPQAKGKTSKTQDKSSEGEKSHLQKLTAERDGLVKKLATMRNAGTAFNPKGSRDEKRIADHEQKIDALNKQIRRQEKSTPKKDSDKPHDSEGKGNLSDQELHDFKMGTLQDSIHRVRKIHDDAKEAGDTEKQNKAAAKLTQHKKEYDELKKNAPKKDGEAKTSEKKAEPKPTEKKKATVHISDMTASQKVEIAKKLGIKDAENLSMKELDKQMIDKNVEKSLKEFKAKKKESADKPENVLDTNQERALKEIWGGAGNYEDANDFLDHARKHSEGDLEDVSDKDIVNWYNRNEKA